nr:hypothetical protein [Tanacetum cinerariifolium]
QADWKDDTDDEFDDQELEAHYIYMDIVQEVSSDAVDSGPIFNTEPEQKISKTKNNSLELSNNQFKEANNKLSKENDLLYADFKKSQAKLKRQDILSMLQKWNLNVQK